MAGQTLVKERLNRVELNETKRSDKSYLIFRLIGTWILVLEIVYLIILGLSR